jgi:hypothetical protein
MLVPMLTRAAGRRLPAPTALMAVAASLAEASAAVGAGADVVDLSGIDLGDADESCEDVSGAGPGEALAVAEFRARHPGVLVCAAGPAADLVRCPATAIATGALLICDDPAAARASGLPAAQLIVAVMPDDVAGAATAGWAALVDADRAAGLAAGLGDDDDPAQIAGIVAIAAVSCWLGAAAVRTRHPRQVRRALDMAASILGIRPPERTVRGLA